jgi:carbonyl reductase 1
MTAQRIALVTGANQGIGYALVEGLAARMRPNDLVLLTGRNPQRVADAAARVASAAGTIAEVQGRELDVTDASAIARLASELRDTYGGVDIVISNAGARITPERPPEEQIDEFVAVANDATVAILRSYPPVLRPGGRLLVVASGLGTLGHLDKRLHPLFDDATLDEIESVTSSWRAAVHAGTAQAQGWPRWVNTPSKVAQVAAVRAVARHRRDTDLRDNTLIASVCPGLVDTAASRPWFADFSQAQTPPQAAAAVLDLALSDTIDPATYGELVQFGKVLPWHSGAPLEHQERLVSGQSTSADATP